MSKNPINEFLEGYTKHNTIINYKKTLNNYFKGINEDPLTYFDKKRDCDKDIQKFIESLNGKAPVTIKTEINMVKIFLEENGVNLKKDLSKKTLKLLKLKTNKVKPITQDLVCTPNELKKILQYGTLKDRALFLFLSSTGCRIDEALNLTFDDVRLDKKPARVYIPANITKTNEPRVTFMSYEARDCLAEWKNHRPKYLHQAVNKSIREKFENDPKIFPYTYPTANRMWKRLLKQSGYTEKDKSTSRYKRHIHTLRKYFRIYLAPKATSDVTELLMGHQDLLGNVYRDRYPESKLAELYERALPDISVFESTPDLSEHNERISALEKENQKVMEEMQYLMAKSLRQDDLIKELMGENIKLKKNNK